MSITNMIFIASEYLIALDIVAYTQIHVLKCAHQGKTKCHSPRNYRL